MNILEKIFLSEKTEQQQFTTDHKTTDLLFDWFMASNIEISTFENDFLNPIKDIYASPENEAYVKSDNINSSELVFYLRIAYPYIIYKNPDNRFLERLFGLYQVNNSLVAHVLNLSPHSVISKKHPEFFTPLAVGRSIVKYYHAIHLKISESISYLPHGFNNLKQCNEELYFEKIFDYVNAQQFKEKAYMFFLLFNSSYDYYTYHTESKVITNEKYANIIEKAFKDSIVQCNSLYGFNLHFEDFILINNIVTLEAPATRRSITLEKFPEGLSFIQKTKSNETRIADTVIYFLMNQYLYDHLVYWKPILQKLAQNLDCDIDWLLYRLKTRFGLSGKYNSIFIFENFYTEVLKKLKDSLNYEDEAVILYENLLFKQAYNKFGKPNSVGLTVLRELAQKLENTEWKQMYSSKLSDCYSRPYAYEYEFYQYEASDRVEQIQSLLNDLQVLIPISVIIIPKKILYDDNYIAKISYNNIEYKIYVDSISTKINSLLQSADSPYRLTLIPVYGSNFSYFYSFAFMSYSEFKFSIESYVIEKFAKDMTENQIDSLINTLEIEKLKFDPRLLDAISFADFKAAKLSEKSSQKTNNFFLEDPNWVWFKNKYVDTLNSKEQWYKVMNVIVQCSGAKKPNAKWLSELKETIENFGAEKYFKELQVLMSGSLKEDFWYDPNFKNPLNGLLWSCTLLFPNDLSLSIVRIIIQSAYAKIPGIGPKSAATGNLGLEALVNSGKDEAVGMLVIMRNKTKYNNFARALEKSIDKFKAGSTTPEQLLADKTIPRFEFKNGVRVLDGGNCTLQLSIENQKITKQWISPKQEKLKNAPYDINKKTLEEINQEVKQITTVYNDLKKRIKTYWLYNRTWTGTEWKLYLLEHPLISSHIHNLVWTNKSNGTEFILINNVLLDINGALYNLDDGDEVCLWHPALNTEENIAQWQNYIWSNNIKQPERQVFREHYPFSDTEQAQTESSRFAHHFLEVKN